MQSSCFFFLDKASAVFPCPSTASTSALALSKKKKHDDCIRGRNGETYIYISCSQYSWRRYHDIQSKCYHDVQCTIWNTCCNYWWQTPISNSNSSRSNESSTNVIRNQ